MCDLSEEEMDGVIWKKSAGGSAGYLREALIDLASRVDGLSFRVFCAVAPDGRELWRGWERWGESRGDAGASWVDYLEHVRKETRFRTMGPRRCLLTEPLKSALVLSRLSQPVPVGQDDLDRLYLEDVATMRRLAPLVCRGCHQSRCAHHAAFSGRQK